MRNEEMKLPPLPEPYYWSSVDDDINIASSEKEHPRDILVEERRNWFDGVIHVYAFSTDEDKHICYYRNKTGSLVSKLGEYETQEAAIAAMYAHFLMGEFNGTS